MELVMKMGKNEWAFAQGNNCILRVVKSNKDNRTSTASFAQDFEDIVQIELQKSLLCINLINQDIACHQKELRFQLKVLKEFWRLVPPSNGREERAIKIMNKIANSRQAIADGEERLFVITQRILMLEQQLSALA